MKLYGQFFDVWICLFAISAYAPNNMANLFQMSKISSNFAKDSQFRRISIMKKSIFLAIAFAIAFFFGSCSSSKYVAYFQNIDTVDLQRSAGLYDAKIMPKDQLTITVATTNPEASRPFNLMVSNTLSAGGQVSTGQGSLQTYLVGNDGNIDFPVVGRVHVQGLTKGQCEAVIREKIKPYMAAAENPVVTVRMSSYRVTVLGEVARPGVVPVSSEKMSILEALASAGDLTIYGRRDNVLLIREDEKGEKSYHKINLNDAGLISSPYYYLQQNDIIYVEPNKVKAKNSAIGTSTTLWFTFVSILTSVAALVVNIVKN